MAMFFYQLSPKRWNQERYRLEIWEGEQWHWPVRKKTCPEIPKPGDTVVFYYSKSGGTEPAGFYGWAVIFEYYQPEPTSKQRHSQIYFRPTAPSDLLKMFPWCGRTAKSIADKIRGKMTRATLWLVPRELERMIRRKLTTRFNQAPNPQESKSV